LGYDIRTTQELLAHRDVSATMIYTHVLNQGGRVVRSPLRWRGRGETDQRVPVIAVRSGRGVITWRCGRRWNIL